MRWDLVPIEGDTGAIRYDGNEYHRVAASADGIHSNADGECRERHKDDRVVDADGPAVCQADVILLCFPRTEDEVVSRVGDVHGIWRWIDFEAIRHQTSGCLAGESVRCSGALGNA